MDPKDNSLPIVLGPSPICSTT